MTEFICIYVSLYIERESERGLIHKNGILYTDPDTGR
jgi:hypothetical protein